MSIELGLLQKAEILTLPFRKVNFPDAEKFLNHVGKNGFPDASESPNFAYAKFGRDGEKYAFDSLKYHPERAIPVILGLAQTQGVKVNPTTEEEPGKIIHEYRTYSEDLPQRSKDIFNKLNPIWGDGENQMKYYGSTDATPLFISLVNAYCRRMKNANILDERVIQSNGQEKTIRECVEQAAQWLEDRIINGPRVNSDERAEPHPGNRLKLLEFKRMNEEGLYNQNWKDSDTSLIHKNGTSANHEMPIATIDLQGYAYDGLIDAADLLWTTDPQTSIRRRKLAWEVRDTTFKNFWIEDKNYFAVALDRDSNGNYRKITTVESNPAEILNTGIFDGLSETEKQLYVGSIVKKIYSNDFLTEAGVRSRSVEESGLLNFCDYHGSYAVWAKNTSEIAKGLERQGFPRLANQLKLRVINSVRTAGSFYELFYISPDGKVIYNPKRKKTPEDKNLSKILAPAFPEEMQTWTGSAVNEFEEELNHGYTYISRPNTWEDNLDNSLLNMLPQTPLITDESTALKKRLHAPSFYIDTTLGRQLELEFKTNSSSK
ncbi:MAG TPA: hypothetical protein VF189_03565 [Patescibacteria group bacterium]